MASSQIIPSNRLTIWQGNVGVPGGIPNRTIIYTTISSGASTATIQSALNACPSNEVVQLSAGSYTLSGTLTIPSGVTLRGAGIGQTVLYNNNSSIAILIGTTSYGMKTGNAANITSAPLNQGATNCTVSSASGFSAGKLATIAELNDSTVPVTDVGDSGTAAWCDDWGGTRAAGQIVLITSVSGSTVTFSPPAYWTYPNSLQPLMVPFSAAAQWAGVEDLTVYAYTGSGYNFYIGNGAFCWLYNVEGNFAGSGMDHADIMASYRCEVRHCFFHDGFLHAPGTGDDDLMVAWKSSGILIEDNIFWRLHTSVIFNWGASGNVLAYNFSTNIYTDGSSTFQPIDFDMCHGAHTMFNLAEGNICQNIMSDSIWGTSSHSTIFRNYVSMDNFSTSPESARYGASVSAPLPAPIQLLTAENRETQAEVGIWVGDLADDFNIVGNIVGDTYVKNTSSTVYSATSANLYNGIPYEFLIGANTSGGAGSTSLPSTTMVREGNFDVKNNSQQWTSGVQSIPNSYYLTAKPSYFGILPWPPINPANPSSTSVTNIPAGYRFVYGVDPPTGTGTAPPAPQGFHVVTNAVTASN